MGGSGDWARALETWLEPFLARLGHPARRRMCPLYVAGLIGPGERKSLQPIAERLAPPDYDEMHHVIAVGPWDNEPLEAEVLAQADRLVGGSDGILLIDDTALPEKDQLSVCWMPDIQWTPWPPPHDDPESFSPYRPNCKPISNSDH